MTKLLEPTEMAGLRLQNRIAMAPLTRQRADQMGVPKPFVRDYYSQRSSAGLIIAEGSQPSFAGQGYCRTPGMHTADQISSWKNVTSAVHQGGAKMFIQLMHVGRIAHKLNRQIQDAPVAPSAVKAAGKIWTDQQQMVDMEMPRELSAAEIKSTIEEFVQASQCARDAGFDGVELHAANGYLLNQFLASNTNLRSDEYGGSPAKRARAVVEAVLAVGRKIGLNRTAIRISPGHMFNDLIDEKPLETHRILLNELPTQDMAYVHLMLPDAFSPTLNNAGDPAEVLKMVRQWTKGNLIAAGNLNAKTGGELLEKGVLQMAVFGRPFIANPDLVERIKKDYPLSEAKQELFYTPGPEGYSDYPPYRAH